jgi:hypothetical protein
MNYVHFGFPISSHDDFLNALLLLFFACLKNMINYIGKCVESGVREDGMDC